MSRDTEDMRVIGFRSSEELADWQRANAASPQPAAQPEQPEPGGLTDERIAEIFNEHTFWNGSHRMLDDNAIARAIEREVLATTRKLLDQEPLNAAGETPAQHAHRWATELAISMARKLYPEVQQFEPLPDLLGVITQIDNMVTGLQRKRTAEQNARIMEAMRRAFSLGETYWQQADSESYSQNRKADITRDRFNDLCAEVERLLRGEA